MKLMSWQFLLFTKIIALKTSVKSVTVAFIVKYHSLECLCLKRKNTVFFRVPCFTGM